MSMYGLHMIAYLIVLYLPTLRKVVGVIRYLRMCVRTDCPNTT